MLISNCSGQSGGVVLDVFECAQLGSGVWPTEVIGRPALVPHKLAVERVIVCLHWAHIKDAFFFDPIVF